ncbi:MAG: type IV secretion protein Rhs [Lysobacter sp.]|nr:type IV secretion protein Rhs [Lysobacter sp.]
MTTAAKHFDPQLGIDIHMYVFPPVPLPVPLPTPHIGIVLDPFDYLPFLGGTVHVNGIKRATAGTGGLNLHIPMGAYHPAFLPKLPTGPQTDDELFMGSMTVSADGDPFSKLAMPVLDCNVVGMVPPFRIRKPKKPKLSLTLPTAVNLAIPTNVNVGGPPTISLMAMAMKGLFKLLGPVFKRGGKAFKKLRQKVFGNMKPGFLKCKVLRAEPVDIRTGSVSVTHEDFAVPGRLPLAWTREYGSNNDHIGACGHGWETPADIRLELDADGSVLFHGGDGIAVFPQAPDAPGLEHAVREFVDGARLYAQGDEWLVRCKDGLRYAFARPAANLVALTTQTLPIQRIEDASGNAWRFERRGADLVRIVESGTVDPVSGQPLQGRFLQATSRQGRIEALELHDPATGRNYPLVRYEYNDAGDLVSAFDPLDAPRTFDYRQHRMVRHTDRLGLSFHYAYDDQWRVIHSWGDGGLYDYRFAYDDLLGDVEITDSLGHTSLVKFDEYRLPLCEIDPLGGVTVFEYDEAGRTTAVVDPEGLRTEFVYDERGNLLQLTRADGSTLQTQYDEDDRPIAVIDPLQASWQQRWDERDLLVEQISPLGATSTYGYDAHGQLTTHTNALGAVTALHYDRHGYLQSLTDPLGGRTLFQHDALGRLIEQTDPAHQLIRHDYDVKGRLLSVTQADGSRVRAVYDAEDQLIRYTDEAGAVTQLAYAGIGQIARRLLPDGQLIQYEYDSEQRLTAVINQRGERYQLKRDALGRIIEEIDFWDQSRDYRYDASSRLTHSRDALGQQIAYATDPLGRITAKTLPHPDRPGLQAKETFRYDAGGQLIELRNAHRQVKRRYDLEGRLLEEDQDGFAVSNTYDELGHRIVRSTSAGNRVACVFDLRGQLQRVTINDEAPVVIERDALGRVLTEHLSPQVQRQLSYDERGLLTAQAVLRNETPLFDTCYAYDNAGNQTQRRDSQYGHDTYTYDPMGRILAHTDPRGTLASFLYDPAGDRLRTQVLAKRQQQVAGGEPLPDEWSREGQHGGLSYAFDRAGNLVRRGQSGQDSDASALHLRWDAAQRLVESIKDGQVTRYGYDALGRRAFKRNPTRTTWFFWDGTALLAEVAQENNDDLTPGPISEGLVVDLFEARQRKRAFAGLHARAREYVYYPESFVPLALIDPLRDGEAETADIGDVVRAATPDEKDATTTPHKRVFHYHVDPNGCPTRATDPRGHTAWAASYTAWGEVSHQHIDEIDNPLRLQGQYCDAETGLHYNLYRYYEPKTGEFVGADPLRMLAGEHLYRFAPNALEWSDPLGLSASPIPGVANGEFANWFNNLTPDEFDAVWKDHASTIKDRLRHPGGMHEWLLVSRADVFKRWGVTAEQIWEWRTPTSTTGGINPNWRHGRTGSTSAHNEILGIIDSSLTFDDFKRRLNNWANFRLSNGINDLPSGLRMRC